MNRSQEENQIPSPEFRTNDACGCRHTTSVVVHLLRFFSQQYEVLDLGLEDTIQIITEKLSTQPDQTFGSIGNI